MKSNKNNLTKKNVKSNEKITYTNRFILLWMKIKNKFNNLPRIAKTILFALFNAIISGIIGLLITYFIDDFHHSYESYVPFIIFAVVFTLTFIIDFIAARNEF